MKIRTHSESHIVELDDGSMDAPSLDEYGGEPTERYGSPQDREARERVPASLQDLLAMLRAPMPPGMGHNNPPEQIDDTGGRKPPPDFPG